MRGTKETLMGPGVRDDWETPIQVLEMCAGWLWLERGIDQFELDVAASEANYQCPRYYTQERDGLYQRWDHPWWCNPPYGREIGKWLAKASSALAPGMMLLPAHTDTQWFHEYVNGKREVKFIKGRITFELGGEPVKDAQGRPMPAPFPSMVVVF